MQTAKPVKKIDYINGKSTWYLIGEIVLKIVVFLPMINYFREK